MYAVNQPGFNYPFQSFALAESRQISGVIPYEPDNGSRLDNKVCSERPTDGFADKNI
jgi:hypothetical protein